MLLLDVPFVRLITQLLG